MINSLIHGAGVGQAIFSGLVSAQAGIEVSAVTAAVVAATAGPAVDGTTIYVDEFDAVYRWHLGDATAADGYRVLTHTGGTAGTWILVGDRITLSPLGGGLDDWARLMAACAAMAYQGEVWMQAGSWRCDTAPVGGIANGAVLRGNPGVQIAATLPKSAPADFSNSVFYNSGNRDLTLTTVVGAVARGANSIVVASAAGIAIGTRLLIEHGLAYWTQREVVDVIGTTLTLDRPVLRPYSNNDVVSVLTSARDIKIYGGGMVVTGSAVAITQLTSARDCYVEDVHAHDIDMQFGHVWDVASRDCKSERCTVDCGSITPGGFLLAFGAENIEVVDCETYRPGPLAADSGVYIASADNCRIVRGCHEGGTGIACLLTRDDPTDTIGCQGVILDSVWFGKSANQGVDIDIGNGNAIVNCETSYNQTGVTFGTNATNNEVIGGVARGNTVIAAGNSGIGNRVIGQTVSDFNHHAYECFGGDMEIADCVINDTSASVAVESLMVVNSANAVMRIKGVKANTNRNAEHFVRQTNATARIYISGGCRFVGTSTNNFGVLVDAGIVQVDDLFVSSPGAGGRGLVTNGATGGIRIGTGVDVSGCATPIGVLGGGSFNRGRVALTAATALAIAWVGCTAQDQFKWSYETDVNASGVVIAGAPIAGTGFTIVGRALDTSIINYSIDPT